jgi:hypothetical protein
MKHRLLNLFAITSLLLVFLSSSLASMLPSSFRMPVAHAASNHNYLFYTRGDGNSLAALQNAIEDRDENDAAFAATHVFVKGGVFGDKAFQMNFNVGETSCAQADHLSASGCSTGVITNTAGHFGGQDDDLYVYSGQYACQPDKKPGERYVASGGSSNPNENYVVTFEVSLNMAGDADLFSGDKLNENVRMHWVGFGTENTPGVTRYPASSPGTARHSGAVDIKDLPNVCLPNNIPKDVYDASDQNTERKSEGIVNLFIPVYPVASKDIQNEWDAAFKAGGINPNNGGGGTDDKTLGCDFSASPLSWIICPVVDLMVAAISWVDNLITDQMTIPTQEIFCSGSGASIGNTCDAYYSAWVSFRNIALGLLVAASLIIIIAQAVGMEILDAYTIRKTLPRILVAAIAITLSWPLMNFAVTLSNDLGFGIRNLITAPFESFSNTIHLDLFGKNAFANLLGGGFGLAGAAVAAVPVWIVAGGLGALLSYVATAGLAVLIAILVLLLRQIAVIMLILLSPLALVAYILPNTQRIFRVWWESFSKALLMFPLIAAFIATGRVFAAISMQGSDPVHGFIAFIAYFAPYFLIPLTFRFAGGTMSSIGSFIQQRSQGVSNALQGYRSNQRQQRVARARGQGLYRKDLGEFDRPFAKNKDGTPKRGGLGKMLNTVGLYSLDADEQIPLKLGGTRERGGWNLPGFRQGAARDYARIDQARREQTSQALQQVSPGYKGGRLMAGLYVGEEHDYIKDLPPEARAELDSTLGVRDRSGKLVGHRMASGWNERNKLAQIMSKSTSPEVREGAKELATASELLSQYNLSHETQRVDPRFLGLQAAAVEGRLGNQDIIDNHNAIFDAGDPIQAQHETTTLQQMAVQKRTSMARGHSIEFDGQGRAINVYADPLSPKAVTSIKRESLQERTQGKAEDLQGLHGETLIAAMSPYKMHFDPNGDNGSSNGKARVGRVESTGERKPEGSAEAKLAEVEKEKFKTAALYNYGDSGVQLELRRIWERAGLPAKELVVGRHSKEDLPPDLRDREAAPEPTQPEPPQQGQ